VSQRRHRRRELAPKASTRGGRRSPLGPGRWVRSRAERRARGKRSADCLGYVVVGGARDVHATPKGRERHDRHTTRRVVGAERRESRFSCGRSGVPGGKVKLQHSRSDPATAGPRLLLSLTHPIVAPRCKAASQQRSRAGPSPLRSISARRRPSASTTARYGRANSVHRRRDRSTAKGSIIRHAPPPHREGLVRSIRRRYAPETGRSQPVAIRASYGTLSPNQPESECGGEMNRIEVRRVRAAPSRSQYWDWGIDSDQVEARRPASP